MAFTSNHNNSDRAKVTIAVTVLQAAAIYGIVVSLTTVINRPAPIADPTAVNIPLPPTPTPTPTPTAAATQTMALPTPLPGPTFTNESLQPTPVPTTIASSGPTGGPIGTGVPTAQPTQTAAFKAKGPATRGRPGEWVTTSDYPSQDQREGNQGLVRVRLEVNAAGRATACTVTQSSGFPRLDAATCAKLLARSRFDPATDENGARISGTWSTSVRWAIPAD